MHIHVIGGRRGDRISQGEASPGLSVKNPNRCSLRRMSSFPAFTHYALTVSNLERSIEWYERLFGSPPAAVNDEDNYRAAMWFEPTFAMHENQQRLEGDVFDNFESDSTTLPSVALVEKSSNPGQHDLMHWASIMARSLIDLTGPVSHSGIRTTFSSNSS